ncbi:MAG: hypothetical protein ACLFQV_05740 [Vulcanimicrobiota bacterium]
MGQIDPTNIQGFQVPFNAEVGSEVKKKLKETKMDTYEESMEEAGDAFVMSDAAKNIPEQKKEAFMADAKADISDLDPESESFIDQATERLVGNALKKEYGNKFASNPGYEQMENTLKNKLLKDPRYRNIIEDFLGKLLDSE